GVHLLAPGPEAATTALGAATQRAVEGVAVAVGQAGHGQAVQPAGRLRRVHDADLDRGEPLVRDAHEHSVDHLALTEPGVLEPERGDHDASLASVSASASTPARQSAVSACSSGECEMPVGLRTNSIAVGT